MKIGKCTKGWWIFYFHEWEYRYDIKVLSPDHWLYNILKAGTGGNTLHTNKRYVCTKCNEVEPYDYN